jgi:hypothetical protein
LAQSKDKAEAIVKEMLIAMGGANNYNILILSNGIL